MPTEADILTLAQWMSPAFPIGSFAYSHGLEGAVDQGWVKTGADLEAWLQDVLVAGAGTADAVLIAAAYRSVSQEQLQDVDGTARAMSASKERLLETDAQGKAFGRAIEVWGIALSDLTYPVALGAAASSEGLPLTLTQTLYLQAFLSNLLAAAQRLLPVGQQEALQILRGLTPVCTEVAEQADHGNLEALTSQAFLTDIASMRHETQYSRIFRT